MAGPQLGVGNSNYTPLSTAGTSTLNGGQAGPIPSSQGVLYGASCVLFGTAPVLTISDVIPPSNIGTNTTTTTNVLMNATFTAAGQNVPAGIPGVGVRYKGALVAVYSGVASAVNALWD